MKYIVMLHVWLRFCDLGASRSPPGSRISCVGAMKAVFVVLALAACAHAGEVSPIGKVIQMLGDLETKIISEGTAAQKIYDEFSEMCEDRSKELQVVFSLDRLH